MVKKQRFPNLVGSKWTAQQAIMGWQHFQVVNRKNQGHLVFAELVATCDGTVRFWLNAKLLKNQTLWRAGWQPLAVIQQNLRVSHAVELHESQNLADPTLDPIALNSVSLTEKIVIPE